MAEKEYDKKQLEDIVAICATLAIERTRIEVVLGKKDGDEAIGHQLEYGQMAMQLLGLYERMVPAHVKEKVGEMIKPEYIKKFHENFGRY